MAELELASLLSHPLLPCLSLFSVPLGDPPPPDERGRGHQRAEPPEMICVRSQARGGSTHPSGCFCSHSLRIPFVLTPEESKRDLLGVKGSRLRKNYRSRRQGEAQQILFPTPLSPFSFPPISGCQTLIFFFPPSVEQGINKPQPSKTSCLKAFLHLKKWLTIENPVTGLEGSACGIHPLSPLSCLYNLVLGWWWWWWKGLG